MKRLLTVLTLCLLTKLAIAEHVSVQCYSGERQIFNKVVQDALPGEGFVEAMGKHHTYVIVADCVLSYSNHSKRIYKPRIKH